LFKDYIKYTAPFVTFVLKQGGKKIKLFLTAFHRGKLQDLEENCKIIEHQTKREYKDYMTKRS